MYGDTNRKPRKSGRKKGKDRDLPDLSLAQEGSGTPGVESPESTSLVPPESMGKTESTVQDPEVPDAGSEDPAKLTTAVSVPGATQLFQMLEEVHNRFLLTFSTAVEIAREGGTILLKLETLTGLRGEPLFNAFREATGSEASDSTLFGYRRVASRWTEITIKTGENISSVTYTACVKIAQHSPGQTSRNICPGIH